MPETFFEKICGRTGSGGASQLRDVRLPPGRVKRMNGAEMVQKRCSFQKRLTPECPQEHEMSDETFNRELERGHFRSWPEKLGKVESHQLTTIHQQPKKNRSRNSADMVQKVSAS
ncbi:MAG: hypothetical protein ACTHLW_17535 [Verrucomicrobiota bacterium]